MRGEHPADRVLGHLLAERGLDRRTDLHRPHRLRSFSQHSDDGVKDPAGAASSQPLAPDLIARGGASLARRATSLLARRLKLILISSADSAASTSGTILSTAPESWFE
jgi:hypothetical protein